MIAHLWSQVWQPTWEKVVVPYLQQKGLECSVQSYLSVGKPGAEQMALAAQAGFTPADGNNLQTLLQVELSFLRSQVWRDALVAEFKVLEHNGEKLYEFRTSRAFKTAGKSARGDLPAATRWPLPAQQSALVHSILHMVSSGSGMFRATSSQAVGQLEHTDSSVCSSEHEGSERAARLRLNAAAENAQAQILLQVQQQQGQQQQQKAAPQSVQQ
eukprot:19580-Heterococcus_DN1.PRE.1